MMKQHNIYSVLRGFDTLKFNSCGDDFEGTKIEIFGLDFFDEMDCNGDSISPSEFGYWAGDGRSLDGHEFNFFMIFCFEIVNA